MKPGRAFCACLFVLGCEAATGDLSDGSTHPDTGPRDAGAKDTGPVDAAVMECKDGPAECAGAIVTPPGTCEAGAHWECIAQRCVSVCDSMRVCMPRMEAGTCYDCTSANGMVARHCAAMRPCFPDQIGTARIEHATCAHPPESDQGFVGSRWTVSRSGMNECTFNVYLAAGTIELGSYVALDDGTFTGGMYGGNGGECSGLALPTDAFRIAWSCPTCQYVMMFE